jgi:hypothetical protein
MFDPKFWAVCRVCLDGYVDIETGLFHVSATKYKEGGSNFSGKNKPYAEDILKSLVRSTDISENELTLAIAKYQAEYKALRSQLDLAERRAEEKTKWDERIAVK